MAKTPEIVKLNDAILYFLEVFGTYIVFVNDRKFLLFFDFV